MSIEDLQEFNTFEGGIPEFWYFACPLWHEDTLIMDERFELILDVIEFFMKEHPEVSAFSPVVYTYPIQRRRGTKPKAGWYMFDIGFLIRALRLCVMRFKGWDQSKGVALEIATAKANGIPISYLDVNDLFKGNTCEIRNIEVT